MRTQRSPARRPAGPKDSRSAAALWLVAVRRVQLRQTLHGNTQTVQQQDHRPAQQRPEGTPPVSSRRRSHGERNADGSPRAFQSPHERIIFQDRDIGETAETLVHAAAHEDGAVPEVRPHKPLLQMIDEGEQDRRGSWFVEAQGEVAADDLALPKRRPHGVERSIGKSRVGVQEEEDVSARGRGAGTQLRSASTLRCDDNSSTSRGKGDRTIAAPAVGHDPLPRRTLAPKL